jgi:hypothetical protein
MHFSQKQKKQKQKAVDLGINNGLHSLEKLNRAPIEPRVNTNVQMYVCPTLACTSIELGQS